MKDNNPLPEATSLRIIAWASDNAQTETSSFSETRYYGLVDGAKHEATRSLKLIEALYKILKTKQLWEFPENTPIEFMGNDQDAAAIADALNTAKKALTEYNKPTP